MDSIKITEGRLEMKQIVDDVYEVLKNPPEISDEWTQELGIRMAMVLKNALRPHEVSYKPRMSSMGRGDRYIYYSTRPTPKEELGGDTLLKFAYGHLIEELLLGLVKLAGHTVSNEQEELDLHGIKGHLDALIDGELIDVKSASSYSFAKFKDGRLYEEGSDPFGYIEQLNAYAQAGGYKPAGWLVMDKQLGKLCFAKAQSFREPDMAQRAIEINAIADSDIVPDRCDTDKPFQKAGNRILKPVCSYCQFKQTCWADCNGGHGLRVFAYSDGPKYLTHVAKLPKPPEITRTAFGGSDE